MVFYRLEIMVETAGILVWSLFRCIVGFIDIDIGHSSPSYEFKGPLLKFFPCRLVVVREVVLSIVGPLSSGVSLDAEEGRRNLGFVGNVSLWRRFENVVKLIEPSVSLFEARFGV